MYQELIDKKEKLAVIGLGYVGLPIALEFARKLSVIGFDISEKRIEMMKKGIDPSNELDTDAFKGCDITFTNSLDELRRTSKQSLSECGHPPGEASLLVQGGHGEQRARHGAVR